MGIPLYLAMTAWEFQTCETLPQHMSWMACHFSPYGTGLSNMPASVPPGSMIILNDRTPIHGHDPGLITNQLHELYERLHPSCFLLDFQRPDSSETAVLTHTLVKSLPCPVGVSENYAENLPCPVFAEAPKPNTVLTEHLAPWKGREIWLETALDSMDITVTEHGCKKEPANTQTSDALPFLCEEFHCHYRTVIRDDSVHFHLDRQKEDLDLLLAEAERMGITTAVGLYQQLK